MNKDLQDLIDTCNQLSARLDRMAEEERKFGLDICSMFERLSFDTTMTLSVIENIKERFE